MPKILISTSSFNVSDNQFLKLLAERGFELILNPHGRRLSENEVMDLLKNNVIGMIAGLEPLTRQALKSAKNLKVISRCGTGIDNVDVEAAKENQITVYTTPEAPVSAVAEFTLGLILSVLRRITEADRNIRRGNWKSLKGNLLSEQTVGIIGYGRIGKRLAGLLKAFGSKIIVYDTQKVPKENGIAFFPLEKLISHSNIVTLHVPYSSFTHHMIGQKMIESMKRGAILINVSRGGLVDEEAVANAIRKGHLMAAGFDVFEEEPYQGPLVSLDQVVLTSHMGSSAKESREKMEHEAAENLVKGLTEKGFINP